MCTIYELLCHVEVNIFLEIVTELLQSIFGLNRITENSSRIGDLLYQADKGKVIVILGSETPLDFLSIHVTFL